MPQPLDSKDVSLILAISHFYRRRVKPLADTLVNLLGYQRATERK